MRRTQNPRPRVAQRFLRRVYHRSHAAHSSGSAGASAALVNTHARMTERKPAPNPSERPLAGELGPVRRWLTSFFRRRIRDETDIEDLVQEVFERIVARDGGEPVQHLGGYVLKTASSVWSDWVRRAAGRRNLRQASLDADAVSEAQFDPERIFAGKQALNQAVAVLVCLPERTRTIFILRRLEGQSIKEIADHFGISISAVEKHMLRAMRTLSQEMEKHRGS